MVVVVCAADKPIEDAAVEGSPKTLGKIYRNAPPRLVDAPKGSATLDFHGVW
jgi:hypothetical protein